MDQVGASVPWEYALHKVRALPDPAPAIDRSRAWVSIRPYPPGIEPAFLGSLWFYYDGRPEPRGPSIQLVNPQPTEGSPALRYLNLFFDPKTGGSSFLDQTAGWRRIDFLFALPSKHGAVAVRAVVERAGVDGPAFVDAGILGPARGVWQFTPSAAELPFRPAESARPRTGFVGGAPKSGTTWMQLMLNQHPDIYAVGEGSMLENATHRPHVPANYWYPPRMNQSALNEFANATLLTRTMQLFREFSGCSMVIDKSPGNARLYRRILAFTPGARLIHCVRHPLDVVVSRLHHESSIGQGGAPSRAMAPHAEAVSRLPELLAKSTPLVLDDTLWPMVAFILETYAVFQEEALVTLHGFPGKLLVVRYEDMLADPEQSAAKVFAHLAVPATPALVAACVRNVSFANLREKRAGAEHPFFRSGTTGQFDALLTPSDQARIIEYLRSKLPGLHEFGYTAEPAPVS